MVSMSMNLLLDLSYLYYLSTHHLVPAVLVPDCALVLDWVFADGPPQQAVVYDNNSLKDFHTIVPKSVPKSWVEEEQRIFRRLQTERRLREEAIRAKVDFLEAL